MKKAKAKRVRKPAGLRWDDSSFSIDINVYDRGVTIFLPQTLEFIHAKHARQLAAWLIRAADYLDKKEHAE